MAYRADYLLSFALVLLQIFVLTTVWRAAYRSDAASVPGELNVTLASATIAPLQFALLNPWRFSEMPHRIREGKIACDLLRPIGLLTQTLAAQAGATAATAPLLLLCLPAAFLIGAVPQFPDAVTCSLYVLSLLLAYVVAQLLALLLGMSAFWLMEVDGLYLVYRVVSQFLSGALVPLWLLPSSIRRVAEILPLQATSYTPTAIFLGRIVGSDRWTAIAGQIAWVLALLGLARLVWLRALRRVTVQGG